MSPEMEKALVDLLDVAVDSGRNMWDSYFGIDNSVHLEEVRRSEQWKRFLSLIEKESGT